MAETGTRGCVKSLNTDFRHGKADIFFTGIIRNRSDKQAIVLQDVGEGDVFAFEEASTGILPTSGVTVRLFIVADLNGDDYPDLWSTQKRRNEGLNS